MRLPKEVKYFSRIVHRHEGDLSWEEGITRNVIQYADLTDILKAKHSALLL